jgi:type II secretory pathway component PulM
VNHLIGLFVEGTVAILLLVTIGYCFLLERRLRRFRANEQSLRATIGELITATEIAERAIGGLKVTVRECDQNLGERLRAAERYCADLDAQLAAGETVLRRISQIAAAGRPAPAPASMPVLNTQSTLAAAHALVERTRMRSGDVAA